MQYGPDTIKYVGGAGEEKEVQKMEIKNRFKMVPTGNIGNVSKTQRLGRAQARYQLFGGNPMINQGELIKDLLINDDERLVDRLYVPQANAQEGQIERQIQEMDFIGKGYTVVPKPTDDDALHMQTIDNMLQDPLKRRSFPADRLEALKNHRDAHEVAQQHKQRASTKDGRAQQEVEKTAQGAGGREARQ